MPQDRYLPVTLSLEVDHSLLEEQLQVSVDDVFPPVNLSGKVTDRFDFFVFYDSDQLQPFLVELSEEEKKKLEIAKAKSDVNTWREFFLNLIREAPNKEKERGDES